MSVSSPAPLRILAIGGANVLTDHLPHGEGLIANALFSGLAGRGHSVTALTDHAAFRNPPPYKVVTVTTGRFESLRPIGRAMAVRRTFKALGGPSEFDVSHWLFPEDEGEMSWAKIPGLPIVLGPMSGGWPADDIQPARTAAETLRDLVTRSSRRRLARLVTSAGLAVSNPGMLECLPGGAKAAATVIPYPIDVARFKVFPFPTVPTVLYLGRLSRDKNVHVLIDAVGSIPEETRPRLVVAGEGPEQRTLHAQVLARGIADSTTFIGVVDPASVAELIGKCTVLCLPSTGEPFGRVVIEAMAAGRPVVAGRGRGPDFLVAGDRGGAQVDGGDADALRDALRRLLENPFRTRQIGVANRLRALQEFDLEPVFAALEALYRATLTAASRD